MQLTVDPADLAPVIRQAVTETLAQLAGDDARLPAARLAFTEPEAASLIGLARHRLRDARLRGEVTASRCGRSLLYERSELLRWLRDSRVEG